MRFPSSIALALTLLTTSPALAEDRLEEDALELDEGAREVDEPSPAIEEPAPEVEAAAPEPEPAAAAPEPPAATARLEAAPTLPVPEPVAPPIPELPHLDDEAAPGGPSAFAPGSPGYYALWYGPEWAFVGLVGAVELFSIWDLVPPGPPLIGPSFSLSQPDAAVLEDPRLQDRIGRPFVREQVPAWTVAAAGLGALGAAGLVDGARHQDLHHTHSLVLGGLTAISATMLATNLGKVTFSRLRPDFRHRYQQAVCQGITPGPNDASLDCSQGFTLEEHDLVDGFRSFPSGHTSAAFSFATYLSLWIGSEWVWADGAGDLAPALGTLAIGGLYASAAWVAATRLEDNRHNVGDVAVGAALGSFFAAASWLWHFNLDGKARWRGVELAPGPGDMGLSLTGRF